MFIFLRKIRYFRIFFVYLAQYLNDYALSLDKVINGTLGVRSSTYNGYQWDEIMSAMSDVFLCGGDCVEDVNRSECHLR